MHHKRKNNTKFPKAKKFFIDIDRWSCGKNKRIFVDFMRPKHKNGAVEKWPISELS